MVSCLVYYTHICTSLLCAHMYVCMHVCIYIYIYIYTHRCISLIHTYMCVYIYIHIYYTCMHLDVIFLYFYF